jgi:hypothetical protein
MIYLPRIFVEINVVEDVTFEDVTLLEDVTFELLPSHILRARKKYFYFIAISNFSNTVHSQCSIAEIRNNTSILFIYAVLYVILLSALAAMGIYGRLRRSYC